MQAEYGNDALRKQFGPIRLRPESIYELATDRADALRLLRRFGYVT